MHSTPLPPPPPPSSLPSAAAPTRRGSGPLVGALVAVAVLAAGGTYLLTRTDDVAAPAAPTTTSAATDGTAFTEGPAATGTIVVPEGALDLGDGVYLPLDSTVSASDSDPYTITNTAAGSSMIIQVLRRPATEDPNVPMQEYIDGFDADFTLAAYLPSQTDAPGVAGYDTVRHSRVPYVLYQPDPAKPNLVGEVAVWVRNDGLTILVDIYGSSATPISDGAFQGMIGALAAAPTINEPAGWFPAAATMPDTVHAGVDLPFNPSRQMVLPAGFEVVDRSETSVTADNGSDTVTAAGSIGVLSVDDAHALAIDSVATMYGGVSVGAFVPGGSGALVFEKAPWSGTATDGAAVTGEVWLQYDAASQTAVVVVVAHRTATWDANAMAMMAASVAASGPGAAGSAGGQ
ncbi:MAG: hypothetical protein ABMA25_03690 [Ilumatobacteraceae bacterium]